MLKILIAACWLAAVAWAQDYASHDNPQLAAYITEALESNPGVRMNFARYRSALQRVPQATALPDPMLSLTPFLRQPETRVGPQTLGVGISQKLPWFGKLSDRGRIAVKEADYQARLYEAAKADIVRQVKQAYFDLAFLDQAIAITREELDLLSHFEKLAAARYSQGVGLQQGVVKLQAEITRQQNRMEQLRTQRVDAEATLNSLMDRPPDTRRSRAHIAARPRLELDSEALRERARRLSPEMQASFEQVEIEEKRIHAARKEYWPDFTVGLGYVNVLGRRDLAGNQFPPPDNGKDVWSLSVGVNIPLGRRQRDAAVLEATEAKIASQEAYKQQRNTIEAAIRSLVFRLQTVENQIRLFEGTLMPQVEQAMRSSEAAYSTGAVGVLDLLDSERMLLDVRLGLAQLESDYMKALAQLERAVGGSIPEVES